jgi:protease I
VPDKTFDEVTVEEFDLLVIPGGGSPENLRIDDRAVAFTRRFVETGKPVAAICHGPQLLISADVLRGRTVTCVKKIRDDVKNAGATYVDEPLVIDGNLITSRVPADLPQFDEAIARALATVPALGGRARGLPALQRSPSAPGARERARGTAGITPADTHG